MRRPIRDLHVLARTRGGLWTLGFVSFLESTVVPVPFEAVMIPVMLADRRSAMRVATAALLGCLLGALAGYLVGDLLFRSLGRWLLEAYGYSAGFADFRARFNQEGGWLIFIVGVSPIPLQIGTIGAGVTGYSLLAFLLLMALARGLRYYGLALVLWLLGEQAADLLRRHRRLVRALAWLLALLLAAHAVGRLLA